MFFDTNIILSTLLNVKFWVLVLVLGEMGVIEDSVFVVYKPS